MIKFFKHGYKLGWELNFQLFNFQIRIAKYQFAIWNNLNEVVNLTR